VGREGAPLSSTEGEIHVHAKAFNFVPNIEEYIHSIGINKFQYQHIAG
jgi:hypothetical protein